MEVDLNKFNLTPKQIRLIRFSLSVQKLSNKPYNTLSRKFIEEWYCHAAIAAIAIERFDRKLLDKRNLMNLPGNFTSWSRGFKPISEAYQIAFNLASTPTPAVIHLTKFRNNEEVIFHTILFLGIQDYQFIFWEKVAANEPFKISTLDDILTDNPDHFWGFVDKEVLPQYRLESPCSLVSAT